MALAAGKPEMAADLLSEALALWRGPALADFAFDIFAEVSILLLSYGLQRLIGWWGAIVIGFVTTSARGG